MKRISFLVGAVLLAFSVSVWAQAQAQAPKPDPELQKLGILVGHWTYEGEYKPGPLGPGGKATGDFVFQRIFGGFFFQQQGVEKGAVGETRGVDIYAYDPASKNIVYSGYGSDGSAESGTVSFSGNTMTMTGKVSMGGKQIVFRAAMTFAPDQMSASVKVEFSEEGKTWAPFADYMYTKVKPAPKTK